MKPKESAFAVGKPITLSFAKLAKDVQMEVPGGTVSEVPMYTLDEAMTIIGYGKFQLRLTFLCGLGWAADAAEVIILSLIGQYLACDWQITIWQNALLTSVVFAGMMCGSPIFGMIGDRFGRRTSLGVSLAFLFLFGAVSAASPSYPWMAVFRALMGFALGGIPQVLTICTEYFPTHLRGRAGFILCYFWSLGTIGVILLSWAIMTSIDSWPTLLAVASIPALLGFISLKWYPESARYYLVSNKYKEAVKVLKTLALTNKKELPPGQLRPITECTQRGRIKDLLGPRFRRSTLLFWYMWLAAAFCYYGIVLMSPIIIQKGYISKSAAGTDNDTGMVNDDNDMTAFVPCVKYTNQDYISLLWISAAEFPAILIFTFLVESCNRKVLMFVSSALSGAFVLMLLLPVTKIVIYLFLFIARGTILAIFQLTLVMMAEAFPTSIRAVAVGTGSAFCRLGGLIAPYFSQMLFLANPVAAVCVLSFVVLFSGVAAVFLPLETRGRGLEETHVVKKADAE